MSSHLFKKGCPPVRRSLTSSITTKLFPKKEEKVEEEEVVMMMKAARLVQARKLYYT